MSHTAESITKALKVTDTPDGKGLKLTVELVVRESGMMEFNGRPINWDSVPGGSPGSWIAASEFFAAHTAAFYKTVKNRWP